MLLPANQMYLLLLCLEFQKPKPRRLSFEYSLLVEWLEKVELGDGIKRIVDSRLDRTQQRPPNCSEMPQRPRREMSMRRE